MTCDGDLVALSHERLGQLEHWAELKRKYRLDTTVAELSENPTWGRQRLDPRRWRGIIRDGGMPPAQSSLPEAQISEQERKAAVKRLAAEVEKNDE
jgi:hypothetical protein